jgi:hypothetical protein
MIYAKGPEMKIDEYEPKMTPIPIVNANCLITPVQRINIQIITRSVANTVPNDLLMVCRRLSSNIFPNKTPFIFPLFCMFSLTLSKMMMVSLILYPIFVSKAMINTESIITVLSSIIHIPYAHAGIKTSKIMVAIVTNAKTLGAIDFLIVANENIM